MQRRRRMEGRQAEEVLARFRHAAEVAHAARSPRGWVVKQVADDATGASNARRSCHSDTVMETSAAGGEASCSLLYMFMIDRRPTVHNLFHSLSQPFLFKAMRFSKVLSPGRGFRHIWQ